MKQKIIRTNYMLLKSLMLGIILLTTTSCKGGGDDTPQKTPQEIAQEVMEATWSLENGGSITLDGSNVSNRYEGFTLRIGNKTYTTTNAGELFPATGTWNWVGTSDNQVTTESGKEITITELSSTRFAFSFRKTDQNVAAGVPGNYVVTLTK